MHRKNGVGNVSTREAERGRPNRRWLERVRGDIKEKGLSERECMTELHISSNIDS